MRRLFGQVLLPQIEHLDPPRISKTTPTKATGAPTIKQTKGRKSAIKSPTTIVIIPGIMFFLTPTMRLQFGQYLSTKIPI
ncbi:hypothetical protein HMPREF1705_04354 [Acetomicrobium hydrogeniformans ATCC BAA-1850]|uniref:Uncharacterized protein n=1 Tax=Acetomicrobium hydrogeniformans ATCC BAA-1850 TaxID=592015 RepID=A0A0T5X9Z2_9BACT|nr:hypothetical protein HMPREF1705_04354 [Acetomicrobium hydrogeniformans ATCC BAA-1850]